VVSARRAGSGGRPVGLPKTGGRAKGTPNCATLVLKEKLAALGCDPAEELVRIARDTKTPLGVKVIIVSTLLPFMYPKRKPVEDPDEEHASIDVKRMCPEEALDLARELISVFGPSARAQLRGSTPVIDCQSNPLHEERDDENQA
jgi:hypothetical protein